MLRWIIRVLIGIAILIILMIGAAMWLFRGKPSVIVDFHPSIFPAQAPEPFFYSTRTSLKYGESITSNTGSLYTTHGGRLGHPLVSPDHTRIAFVDDGQLLIASHNGPIRRVATVDSIYHGFDDDRKKPLGHDFFRDSDYQWSSDSRHLYLIHDQFYDLQGTQLYSKHGELWKYDLETGGLQLVLKPFSAYQFFFGKSGIYFSVPTSVGDLQLQYFDGKQVVDIGQPKDHFFPNTILNGKPDQIFYSFSTTDSPSRSRPDHGLTTAFDGAFKKKKYQAGQQYLMSISEGATFKGPYYCGADSADYLPGQQFAVLNMVGCDPYDGQILIDLSGARYMQLPKDTYVYLPHNTQEEPNYSISGGGITR
jgi:hypothetical protein